MKKFNKNLVAIALVVPVSFSVWAGNNANGTMQNGGMGGMQNNMMGHSSCQLDANQIQQRTLSQSEIDGLKFMREEEKLARDVYQVLYKQTSAMVFGNISQSEQAHMDRVAVFLEAYAIPDPAKAGEGDFTDQSLQALYTDLIAQGSESLIAAYKVGALIEEVDIEDLDAVIESTEIAELKNMYTALREASYKHLRAFTRQIIAIEGSYTALVLDQEVVEGILNGQNTSMQMGNTKRQTGAEESASNSCFISSLSADQQTLQNGSSIGAHQAVKIAYQVKVEATDVGQEADLIMLANYAASNGANNWFVRSGDQWQEWDGQIGTLPAAATGYVLQSEQTVPVFEGMLSGMPGRYSMYIGYRLRDDSLVYKDTALVFSISDGQGNGANSK